VDAKKVVYAAATDVVAGGAGHLASVAVKKVTNNVIKVAVSKADDAAKSAKNTISNGVKDSSSKIKTIAASSNIKGTGETLKGTKNPVVKEAVEYGKKMHKEFDYGAGVKKEVTLPSGKRMDGYDKTNKIIYELKPDNANAAKKGTKQLEKYVEESNKVNGPGHKGVLKTYPPKKK